MTAEEEVEEDDDDIPDFGILKLNTDIAHLLMDHANGNTYVIVVDIVVWVSRKTKHSSCLTFSLVDEEMPPVKHGNAITDRRSTFQPHLAPVVTPRQVPNIKHTCFSFKSYIYTRKKMHLLQE